MHGSAGCISYFAVGDKDFSKERIEIFGDEKVCIIDDFCELIFSHQGKTTKIKQPQDKGHKDEIVAFFNAIKSGSLSPIPSNSIIQTSQSTFSIIDSLQSGNTVKL